MGKLALFSLTIFYVTLIGVKAKTIDFVDSPRYTLNCPENSVELGEKCYLIDIHIKLNWHQADRFCRRKHGYLASLKNDLEWQSVSDYLVSQNYDHMFWIGGNVLGSDGTYYLSETGNLMEHTRWSSGQPDNANGNEDCMLLWKTKEGFFANDDNCKKHRQFICELSDI